MIDNKENYKFDPSIKGLNIPFNMLLLLWIFFAIHLWAIAPEYIIIIIGIKEWKSSFLCYIISLFLCILQLFTSVSMAGNG